MIITLFRRSSRGSHTHTHARNNTRVYSVRTGHFVVFRLAGSGGGASLAAYLNAVGDMSTGSSSSACVPPRHTNICASSLSRRHLDRQGSVRQRQTTAGRPQLCCPARAQKHDTGHFRSTPNQKKSPQKTSLKN